MKPIFLIIMVLVAVIAGAGSAFFVVKSSGKPAEAAVAHPAAEVELPTESYQLDERTVNLADTAETRYLRLTLAIEYTTDPNVKHKGGGEEGKGGPLDEKKALLFDRMIGVISKHTFKQLISVEGKAKLKEELCTAFNDEVLKGTGFTAKEVLYTDFVME